MDFLIIATRHLCLTRRWLAEVARMSSSRISVWLRWRHDCFRLFFVLLLVQFLVWFCVTIGKTVTAPAPLGRRQMANRTDSVNHEDWIEQEVQRRLQIERLEMESIETVTESVVSGVETFPARRERLLENAQAYPVPDVDDVFTRLKEYLQMLNREHFYMDLAVVKTLQQRTTAAEMHALPMDDFEEMESLPARIDFLNSLARRAEVEAKVHVSVFAASSVDVKGVRSELLPWMQYHTQLGVTHFYILYDGSDLYAVNALLDIDHVTLIHIHPPFATEEDMNRFKAWTDRHQQWGGKPGNFELMVKQGYGTAFALKLAQQRGDDWLMHIDPDELFYPDNAAFSLVDEFLKQPDHVSSLRFMNFEGQPEFGDVSNRYEQVTLFRTHKYFITPEANYLRGRCKLGDNRTFLVLYANGKSAVRVNAPGVRQLGPHFFTGDASDRWKTDSNPEGKWQDTISNSSFLLHYGYSYLSDVTNKAKRSCPGDAFKRAVAVMNKAQLGKCFLIDFDRDAYIAALSGEDQDFFYSRQVLSEGVRLKCISGKQSGWCIVHDVEYFKFLLTKAGLFRRAREPQQILRMHEQLIQLSPRKQFEVENIDEAEDMHPLSHGWP